MTNLLTWYEFSDFIHRLEQCITCRRDPKTCGYTDEDEDSEGMCIYWTAKKDE